jgi:hypothetical protein
MMGVFHREGLEWAMLMSADSCPERDDLRYDSIITTKNNKDFSVANYFIQEFLEIKALS